MKKNNLKFILFLLILFLFNSLVLSQDSIQNSYENNPNLKKGNWAVVFELGTVLFGNINYRYDNSTPQKFESYFFLLKYQKSEKTAFRLGINIGGYSYNRSYDYWEYSDNRESIFVGAGINMQYFITKKYFAKPFVSVGPFYCINIENYSDNKNHTWNVGLDVTFGAEIFVYKGIGVIAEYLLRTSFEKNYSSFTSKSLNYEYNDYRWRNSANTSRLGVSFYF